MSGSNLQPAQTGTIQVSSGPNGGAGVFPIGFGYYPTEGSRCISPQYNWTSQTFYTEDLSQLVAKGVETSIQGVMIDNSSVPEAVILTINGTDQVIVIPANSQGIFPVFFTGTPSFSIAVAATAAGAVTRLYLLNVPPQTAGVWQGASSGLAAISPPNASAPMLSAYETGTATLKTGIGRVFKVSVTVLTATGTITIQDGANVILVIPIGTTAGTVFDLGGFPYFTNLSATYNGGATGSVAISYV